MCFGGRPTPPPPVIQPSPRPPRVMTTQGAPASAEATGRSRSASENVENVRKGRKVLKIPLLAGAGTGVQVSNY